MKLIAHRGLIKVDDNENTIYSFLNALRDGRFVGVEFDVRETLDNKFVVIHDAQISRVSDGYGVVEKMTYEQLLKFNFGTKKNPSKVVLVSEVLKLLPDMIKVIDVKNIKSYRKFVKLINKYKYNYVASFNTDIINNILEYKPIFDVGLFNNVLNSQADYDKYDFIGLHYLIATDNLIKYFLNNDMEVFIFTLTNIKQIEKINPLYLEKCFFIVKEV